MAFCVNCGQQLGKGAKFCTNCGQTVTSYKTESSERKTVYDGEIHKCPNCGEIIDAFVTNCPASYNVVKESFNQTLILLKNKYPTIQRISSLSDIIQIIQT